MWALWGKLYSLAYFDTGWWLQEIFRFAQGEVPYRDFTWMYPPLSLAILGYPLRWFGVRFDVVQVTIDACSLLIVFLSYRLLRYLLPKTLCLLGCLLLIAVCGTTQTYFSLFSFFNYGPSLQVAAVGLLVLLLGAFRYLEEGKFAGIVLGAGAFIALLAKQEAILATVAVVGLLALFDRQPQDRPMLHWFLRSAKLAALCFGPAFAVYLFLSQYAGFRNLAWALSGCGIAANSCPWWPTGLGLWGAGAAIAQVGLLLGAVSLVDRRWQAWFGNHGGSRWRRWIGAAAGTALYAGYEAYTNAADLWSTAPLAAKIDAIGRSVLSTNSTLQPALWLAIFWWLYLLGAGMRAGRRLTKARLQLLLLLTVPVLIGIRGLFSRLLTPLPEIPALGYPFMILIGPFLMLRFLEIPYAGKEELRAKGAKIPSMAVGSLMAIYILIRLGGAYPGLLSNRAFTTLNTQAGTVRLLDGPLNAEVYSYVMEHTSRSDTILELPHGGGIGFATGRREPTYTTLFLQLRPPAEIQALDLQRVLRHPPEVVIAPDKPNLGTYYGVPGNVACAFPRLVWMPDRPAGDAAVVFPVVDFLRRNYAIDRRIGNWMLLRPNRKRSN